MKTHPQTTKRMPQAGLFRKTVFALLNTEKIDHTDRSFALSWPAEPAVESLAEELKLRGMLNPLWVTRNSSGTYRLVHGFRRLAAAHKAGLTEVPALVLSSDLPELELFKARLAGEATRLSAVEAARVIHTLTERYGLPEEELTAGFLPLLGFGASRKILKQLRRLVKLEDAVARYCAQKGVGLKEAALWAGFPHEAQRAVLVLVRAVSPGNNLLHSYLRLLDEICIRDGMPPEQVLSDEVIRSVLLDPHQARSGGRERVHARLRQLRYPIYHSIERTFKQARSELALPREVRIEPPPFFEGGTLKVSFEISSPEDLHRKASSLVQASSLEAARKLFDSLGAREEKQTGS